MRELFPVVRRDGGVRDFLRRWLRVISGCHRFSRSISFSNPTLANGIGRQNFSRIPQVAAENCLRIRAFCAGRLFRVKD